MINETDAVCHPGVTLAGTASVFAEYGGRNDCG